MIGIDPTANTRLTEDVHRLATSTDSPAFLAQSIYKPHRRGKIALIYVGRLDIISMFFVAFSQVCGNGKHLLQ